MTKVPPKIKGCEPLWYLKSIPYREYLATHHWKERRKLILERAGDSPVCACCGQKGNMFLDFPKYHVHHLTYCRIGEENGSDLVIVCSPCHNLIHFPDSAAAKFWLERNLMAEDCDLLAKSQSMRPENWTAMDSEDVDEFAPY